MTQNVFNGEEFGRQLSAALVSRRMTFREAEQEIGVSRSILNRVTQGKTPEVETYLRIKKWLGDEK